jgi:hypothetical protein
MPTVLNATVREYGSGEIVEPGVYMDVDTGAVVEIYERDELPQEVRLVHYSRRFRRLDSLPPISHK